MGTSPPRHGPSTAPTCPPAFSAGSPDSAFVTAQLSRNGERYGRLTATIGSELAGQTHGLARTVQQRRDGLAVREFDTISGLGRDRGTAADLLRRRRRRRRGRGRGAPRARGARRPHPRAWPSAGDAALVHAARALPARGGGAALPAGQSQLRPRARYPGAARGAGAGAGARRRRRRAGGGGGAGGAMADEAPLRRPLGRQLADDGDAARRPARGRTGRAARRGATAPRAGPSHVAGRGGARRRGPQRTGRRGDGARLRPPAGGAPDRVSHVLPRGRRPPAGHLALPSRHRAGAVRGSRRRPGRRATGCLRARILATWLSQRRAGGGRIDQPGLLDGAPGVALALLAAATPVEPTWDRLFLLAQEPAPARQRAAGSGARGGRPRSPSMPISPPAETAGCRETGLRRSSRWSAPRSRRQPRTARSPRSGRAGPPEAASRPARCCDTSSGCRRGRRLSGLFAGVGLASSASGPSSASLKYRCVHGCDPTWLGCSRSSRNSRRAKRSAASWR